MQLSDFSFDLPDELIARYPLEQRSASRLLHLDAQGQYHDHQFTAILDSERYQSDESAPER